MKRVGWLPVVLLLLMAVPVRAADAPTAPAGLVTTLIPVGETPLNEVAEVMPQLLSPQGKWKLADGGRAVQVTDTPESIEAVRSILAELGKPQPVGPNVRVQVNFQSAGSRSSQSVDVRGRYGQVEVPRRRDGRIVVEPIERGSVSVGLDSRSSSSSSNASQFIVVSSGRWAAIEVAREVPFLTYFYDYGVGLGIVPAGFQWQRVGTRLAVRPTVLANGLINVQVAPEISALVGSGRWQEYRFDSLSTTVTVANGATVSLGGFSQADATFNRHFFGYGESGSAGSTSFTISASVAGPVTRR